MFYQWNWKYCNRSHKHSRVSVYGTKWNPVDTICLTSYIGLLLLDGDYKSKHEALPSLWDDIKGRAIFKATMSLQRFQNITWVIRFDDRSNRAERRERDKFAPIRYLWNKWETNLRRLFHPYENVSVGEQLVPFRGRCPFRQYIPSKPAKYGIKILATCCTKINMIGILQVTFVDFICLYNLVFRFILGNQVTFAPK